MINPGTKTGDIYEPEFKKPDPASAAAKQLLAWRYMPEAKEMEQLIAFFEESAGAEQQLTKREQDQ